MPTQELIKNVVGLAVFTGLNGLFDALGLEHTSKAMQHGLSNINPPEAAQAALTFGLGILCYGFAIGFLKELGPRIPVPLQALGWFGSVMLITLIRSDLVPQMTNFDRGVLATGIGIIGYLMAKYS